MQLLNPALWWTLGAIAVPVLIHLTMRRVFRQMQVGTMRFLSPTVVPRKRRARLEEIPLMLVRLLALVLLSLVFLRPYLPGMARPNGNAGETLILMDASGSVTPEMAEEARRLAREVMADGKSPRYAVAAFADRAVRLGGVEDYKPVAGAGTDLAAVLPWALRELQRNPGVSGRLVLIGHFAAAQLPEAAPMIWPPTIPVEVIGLKEPGDVNFAVREISLLTPYAEREMEIEVAVSGPEERGDLRLLMQVEGVRQEVKLPPRVGTATFRFPVPREVVRGTVTVVNGDAWPADNVRPFVFSTVQRKRVLLVDGRPGATPFEGQPYFIGKALEASGAAHGQSPFLTEVRFGIEDNRGVMDLEGYDVVAMCGVADVSTEAAAALAGHVAGGGGLLHVLHDGAAPGIESLVKAGLVPKGWVYQKDGGAGAIAEFDAEHGAFSVFRDKDQGELRDLPWERRFRVELTGEWRPVLRLEDGVPLLLERAVAAAGEGGRVMVLAHPLNRDWNDLPREPMFVPFVRNLFGFLGGLDERTAKVRVVNPGMVEKRAIGDHAMPDGTMELVVADAAEIPVRSVGEEALREAYGLPEGAPPEVEVAPVPAGVPDVSRARELWPWAVVVLLVFLMLETWLATRNVNAQRT